MFYAMELSAALPILLFLKLNKVDIVGFADLIVKMRKSMRDT